LRADSSIYGLCCVTIIWQQIFKGSLVVAEVGVLLHVIVVKTNLTNDDVIGSSSENCGTLPFDPALPIYTYDETEVARRDPLFVLLHRVILRGARPGTLTPGLSSV